MSALERATRKWSHAREAMRLALEEAQHAHDHGNRFDQADTLTRLRQAIEREQEAREYAAQELARSPQGG